MPKWECRSGSGPKWERPKWDTVRKHVHVRASGCARVCDACASLLCADHCGRRHTGVLGVLTWVLSIDRGYSSTRLVVCVELRVDAVELGDGDDLDLRVDRVLRAAAVPDRTPGAAA